MSRRLIESRDDILAAPVKGQISHIHLIISEDSYERNELEATLDSLKLILNGPFFLPYIVYLRAIHFTLNVKLSDEWNEVQNYFVKSDKFLKTKEILQSVRVHLFITGTVDKYLTTQHSDAIRTNQIFLLGITLPQSISLFF